MPRFQLTLVRPDALVFVGEVEQVDLPGAEGGMGVLAGHAPIVTILRPGIVRAISDGQDEKFVVMGGVAEYSNEELTVLANSADRIEDFDVAGLKADIDERERNLSTMAIGQELDREIELLDHYKTLHQSLTVTTAL